MANDYVREYVDALRHSSDRTRYALYVTIIATVLTFVANHNIREDNWPLRRLSTWFAYARETGRNYNPPRYVAGGDAERLQAVRAEYAKQFAARAVLTAGPIPGVSIDINDLGLLSGIALCLLMTIVLVCVAREHENVFLSLYKVRMICSEEQEACSIGDSRANLLYHALAMTQVHNSPPTLARWHRNHIAGVRRLVFLAPAFVYLWVFWSDWTTQHVAVQYGVNNERVLMVELAAVAVLLFLGVVTWAYSSAMAFRWERAFIRVNPGRRLVTQAALVDWLRILPRNANDERLGERVLTEVITRVTEGVTTRTATVAASPQKVVCVRGRLRYRATKKAIQKLVKSGRASARSKCEEECLGDFVELQSLKLDVPNVAGGECILAGVWMFKYRPRL